MWVQLDSECVGAEDQAGKGVQIGRAQQFRERLPRTNFGD